MRRADILRDVPCRARARVPTTGLALLGLAAAACGGGDVTNPLTPADVTGTYALASIGAYPLPAPFGTGTAVIYDTLTLARDSTFRERQGAGALGTTVVNDSGTYIGRWTLSAASGQLVLLTAVVHGSPTPATFTVVNRGASITFNDGGAANTSGVLWVWNRVK